MAIHSADKFCFDFSVNDAITISQIDTGLRSRNIALKKDPFPIIIGSKSQLSREERCHVCNVNQVFCLINTWVAIMRDQGVSEDTLLVFETALAKRGLIAVFTELDDAVTSVLSSFEVDDAPTCLSEHGLRNSLSAMIWKDLVQSTGNTAPLGAFLQVCKFPERFTYSLPDKSGGFAKFREINRHMKEYNYDWSLWPRQYVLHLIRLELRDIIPPSAFDFDASQGYFSDGALASLSRKNATLSRRLRDLSQYRPAVYGAPWYTTCDTQAYQRKDLQAPPPRLTCVPKSMTKSRVIAPENSLISFYGHAALECLRAVLLKSGNAHYINECEQRVNRSYAYTGSVNRTWCTIDSSSASDTLSRWLFMACVPEELKPFFSNFMSEWATCPDGSMIKLQMLYTSGNPLTWLTESIWFLALGRVACRLCGCSDPYGEVYVFGDDVIISAEYYETLIELMGLCGHIVNDKKSYHTGYFRESCGGWFYRGSDVTPHFWPREIVDSIPKLVRTVCMLQHRFYGMFTARSTLEALAYCLDPACTCSPINTECDDLWGDITPYQSSKTRHRQYVVGKVREVTRDAETYLYVQYLLYGPLYESTLDRLLGVSTSRRIALEHSDGTEYWR